MYIYILSKENHALARAEAQALIGEVISQDDLLLAKELTYDLALTRSVHEVIWQGKLSAFNLDTPLGGTFCVRSHNIQQKEQQLASLIWQQQKQHGQEPKVNLKTPDTLITFFNIQGTYYAAKHLASRDSFEGRKSHKRPHNHPTTLHPKLARAMINLAGDTRTILDPFCGAGGILLEAALLGKEVFGSDIDPIQIRRAEENLHAFNQQAMLLIQRAEDCQSLAPIDAIITDLPLGKNAKLPQPDFSEFFYAAKMTANTMIIGALQERSLNVMPWTIEQEFTWYVHKSMTKRILVLK